jgi:hypothetical protein
MRERIPTSEKIEVRWLKTFSYEAGVSELYAWVADKTMIILCQKGSQEDRFERFPHDAEDMKPRKGGDAG